MLTPYYQTENVTLYQGDCREILGQLPSESVDMIFADPPYNLSNGGITCHAGKMVSVNKGEWDKSKGVYTDHSFALDWLQACKRVLKPDGTIWVSGTMHSIYSIGFALQELGYHLLNDISWFKPNAAPNLSCRYFTHSHETLIWAAKSEKSKHKFAYDQMRAMAGGKQMRSVWDITENNGETRSVIWDISTPGPEEKTFGKHPTQKPLALLERVVLASTLPRDMVLDPFAGSSTTGLACMKHNRKFIGIETDSSYLDLSMKRLRETEQKQSVSPMLMAVKEGKKKYGKSGVTQKVSGHKGRSGRKQSTARRTIRDG
ncbi:MAG: site-specific DNA-methyltransferase [Chloroflexota bacterium]